MLGRSHAGTGLVNNLFDCPKNLLLPTTLSLAAWLVKINNVQRIATQDTGEDLPREKCNTGVCFCSCVKVGLPRVWALFWLYRQLPISGHVRLLFGIGYGNATMGAGKFDKVRRPALPRLCAGRGRRKGRCCEEVVAPDDKEGQA